eukprot:GHRR01020504.1.p1 GENE.GHRR01020504.1~~GHRR01020504.1.p1  ORF type:complete len:101 (-),score=9.64 GHRR01020504.1:175-477(-)
MSCMQLRDLSRLYYTPWCLVNGYLDRSAEEILLLLLYWRSCNADQPTNRITCEQHSMLWTGYLGTENTSYIATASCMCFQNADIVRCFIDSLLSKPLKPS